MSGPLGAGGLTLLSCGGPSLMCVRLPITAKRSRRLTAVSGNPGGAPSHSLRGPLCKVPLMTDRLRPHPGGLISLLRQGRSSRRDASTHL
eukprot:1672644-Alexandrium_andersonii.AAC.1